MNLFSIFWALRKVGQEPLYILNVPPSQKKKYYCERRKTKPPQIYEICTVNIYWRTYGINISTSIGLLYSLMLTLRQWFSTHGQRSKGGS